MSKPSVRQNRTTAPKKNKTSSGAHFGRDWRKCFSSLFAFPISEYRPPQLCQEKGEKKKGNEIQVGAEKGTFPCTKVRVGSGHCQSPAAHPGGFPDPNLSVLAGERGVCPKWQQPTRTAAVLLAPAPLGQKDLCGAEARHFGKVGCKVWLPAMQRGEGTDVCSVLGQTLHGRSSQPSFPASLPSWMVLGSPLVLSPLGTMPFWGHRGLDVVPPGGDPLAARRRLSPPAFLESLARRPAAFHCCLFIRLNSLPSLSCSSRGTETELVPAAGPHPLLPRSEGRGRRDTEARGLCPTPPGPRGCAASQQIQY